MRRVKAGKCRQVTNYPTYRQPLVCQGLGIGATLQIGREKQWHFFVCDDYNSRQQAKVDEKS